jgi:predicted nucleic acid-binding protein
MPAKPLVLIDINVILDVLQKREPFYQSSASLLGLAENGQMRGFVSSHTITTLFYLLRKQRGTSEARAVITSLLQILKVAAVDESTVQQALNLDYPDFEDAVQMICALQLKADYLVTRNVKDFQPSLLPVLQPVEFLAVLAKG